MMSRGQTRHHPGGFVTTVLGLFVLVLAGCIQPAPAANVATTCATQSAQLQPMRAFAAPAGEQPAQIDQNGATVIPNGRLLTPPAKMCWSHPIPTA